MRKASRAMVVGLLSAGLGLTLPAQLPEPGAAAGAANPLSDPTVKPGKMLLFDLEARFAKDVSEKGGAAFADWFAEDGVELSNGQAPVVGKVAILKDSNWSAKDYQLTFPPPVAFFRSIVQLGFGGPHISGIRACS